jgi:hypothetical protein
MAMNQRRFAVPIVALIMPKEFMPNPTNVRHYFMVNIVAQP